MGNQGKIMSDCGTIILACHSGSTGIPKGVLHTTGGYMMYATATFKYTFDFHPDDIYWCTADIGWITGHTYVTYGPLANGATSVMVGSQTSLYSGGICHYFMSSDRTHFVFCELIWSIIFFISRSALAVNRRVI